jgi:LPS-assembly protein
MPTQESVAPPANGQSDAQEQQEWGQQPEQESIPVAEPLPRPLTGEAVRIEADHQSRQKNIIHMTGNVVVHYGDYVLRSDDVSYDQATGDAVSPGQLVLDGGPDKEHIVAASGTVNLPLQTGKFLDVSGEITLEKRIAENAPAQYALEHPTSLIGVVPTGNLQRLPRAIFGVSNPFRFTGKQMVKLGPEHYEIYDGTVTSCELPNPDWQFSADRVKMNGEEATLYASVFRLVNVPLFYFPYATHAVDTTGRQTGLLIPQVGTSSIKGTIIGDEFYWAIDRSSDLILGIENYSARGPAFYGQYRYRGTGLDFVQAAVSGVDDRLHQGGVDAVVAGRHDFSPTMRVFGNIEYLSSYLYRQVFAENFSQAVASQVQSTAYFANENHGYAEMVGVEQFQNFESTASGDEIRIQHTPTLSFDALDHPLASGALYWNGNVTADGLRRSEPYFATAGITERADFHPQLSIPWRWQGWSLRAEFAGRDTIYSRSQVPGMTTHGGGQGLPVEVDAGLNRKDGEAVLQAMTPAIERVFAMRSGMKIKHVVQANATYRFVGGIDNFQNVLRFDPTDIVSDTNEVEYGLSQRFYIKREKKGPCRIMPTAKQLAAGVTSPEKLPYCGQGQPVLSWDLMQKYYFEPNFGGAVTPGMRNVLTSTIEFTGAAFLTGPRRFTPILSRVRLRSTEHTDIEWDFDYDTVKQRVQSSSVFAEYRQGLWFGGVAHQWLVMPYESGVPLTMPPPVGGVPFNGLINQEYNQIRMLMGYGSPLRTGFNAAVNAGYDLQMSTLQYGAAEAAYNWNCCGLSIEYLRYALGSVRNENEWRFNFTLAGVGAAGNLRRQSSIF